MNKKLVALVFGILIPMGLFAQQNRERVWWVDEYLYPNTMTWVLQVANEGVMDPTLEIGAFCGDECRGRIAAQFEPVLNDYRWYLNIQGLGGETLDFYVRRDGVELDLVTDFSDVFVENGKLGTITNPYVIDFHPLSPSYYMLITDESQLVAGRKYLIANGFEGTVKAMGGDDSSWRAAVDITCSQRKAFLTPGHDSEACELVLGGTEDAWTLYDGRGEGYLTAGRGGALTTSASLNTNGEWSITLEPTGALTIYNANRDAYMMYDEEDDDPAFLCGDESSLCLLAKCELVSGTMESLTIDDPTKMYVVESGNTLIISELSTVGVSNLVLEDGAQLINASSGVLATLQKTITAYENPTAHDGWYTLASPMVAASVEMGSNLLFPEYDLYYFDETNLTHEEWRNYKSNATNGFTSFDAGRGYLYANATSFVPVFKGTLNSSSVSFPLTYTDNRPDELKGFNLIGNPYPHNIYKGAGGAINDVKLASGYYVLSNSGSWLAQTYDTPIAPGQGALVKTMTAHDVNIAKTNTEATGESRSQSTRGDKPSRLSLHLSSSGSEDVAYVYFGEGQGLEKIGHLNTTNPSLSILQGGYRYAIAHIDAGRETVDVCFDNKMASTFTVNVDTKDFQYGYLHLIDNVTGADVNLLRTPSYTFEATGQEYPCRFKLVLQGVDSDDDEPFAYYADGQIHLLVETCHGASLQIVDMMGRVIDLGDVSGNVSTMGMASGIYMLRLVEGDRTRTQKIVVR